MNPVPIAKEKRFAPPQFMKNGEAKGFSRQKLIAMLCCWVVMASCWFCLWVISSYFIQDHQLAVLFCPFALRLGVTLHSPKKLWPAIYSAEWFMVIALAILLGHAQWVSLLGASMISIPILWLATEHYTGVQWRRLWIMAALIAISAISDAVIVATGGDSFWFAVLVGLSGGLLVVPACYLVWHYLFQSRWPPLLARMSKQPVRFYGWNLLLYGMLFIGNISIQLGLPDEMRRFAPFCLAVPVILLAFQYGWQGAFLGTLINSVALIAARSGEGDLVITDLLLSLSAQSLTGLLLGAGIQQLRELNSELYKQIERNHRLARHLITAEESVRRDISRELHDDIGQNITAIRMQAGILKRLEDKAAIVRSAGTIDKVSLEIYDTAKRLLTRLRPKTLDDMGLRDAVFQLVRDLECEAAGTNVIIEWDAPANIDDVLSDAMCVTLFRICQEALTNTMKYACASECLFIFSVDKEVNLKISDNGIGFNMEQVAGGFGLKGISERVEALGGDFMINKVDEKSETGTQLSITLPRI